MLLGATLLASMHEAGASLRATGVENSALIAEIAEHADQTRRTCQ